MGLVDSHSYCHGERALLKVIVTVVGRVGFVESHSYCHGKMPLLKVIVTVMGEELC